MLDLNNKILIKENLQKIKSILAVIKTFNIIDNSDITKLCLEIDIPKYITENISKFNYVEWQSVINKIEKKEVNMNKSDIIIYDIIKKFIFDEKNVSMSDLIREESILSFKKKEDIYKLENPGKELVYNNQKEAAIQVIHKLLIEDKKAVSLIALPQVGKTGTFLYVTLLALTFNDNDKMYYPENIFIITGMNDIFWVDQTKTDMLSSLENNVYHLGKISSFYTILNNKRNARMLIIIDECQIATSKNQKISSIFTEIEKESIGRNLEIKYLVVTATPSVIKLDLDNWGDKHSVVLLEPPKKYVSFETFFNENRIKDVDYLSENFLNEEFLPLLKIKYKTPKYHILRLPVKQRGFIEQWIKKNHYEVFKLDSDNQDSHIDERLSQSPIKHTFILIKNFWRAGKRMNDKNIGIVYENNQKKNIDVTAQGLVARFCGNDKQSNKLDSPTFFCNIETLKEYIKFIKENCDYSNADYTSQKLKIVNGQILKHHESLMSKIYDGNKKYANLYTIKDYVEKPKSVKITDQEFKLIFENSSKIKYQLFLDDILKNKTDIENKKLFELLKKYECVKFTIAEAAYSYKRHIVSIRNNMLNNKISAVDIPKIKEEKNVWVGFVDGKSEQKEVFIIINHGEKLKQLRGKKYDNNNDQKTIEI
jgi:hypothetical protein